MKKNNENSKKIINLTPHDVNVVMGEKIITFPTVGQEKTARCEQVDVEVGTINGMPLTESAFGEVYNLPEQEEGIVYIVSRLVLSALPHRQDLIVPNGIVRDESGRIIGCTSFARK